jgi:hypothetical protein
VLANGHQQRQRVPKPKSAWNTRQQQIVHLRNVSKKCNTRWGEVARPRFILENTENKFDAELKLCTVRDRSVGIATGWTGRVSNPAGGEISRKRPDRRWGPPSLLYNWRPVTPGVKQPGVALTTHLIKRRG